MSQPQAMFNFSRSRIFTDENSAKAHFRRQGMSEEEIAKMEFVSVDKVPLRVRRRIPIDDTRQHLTRNQRRNLCKRLARMR